MGQEAKGATFTVEDQKQRGNPSEPQNSGSWKRTQRVADIGGHNQESRPHRNLPGEEADSGSMNCMNAGRMEEISLKSGGRAQEQNH